MGCDLLLEVIEVHGVAGDHGFRRVRPVAPRRWPLNVVGNQAATVDWVSFGNPAISTVVNVDWTVVGR